MEGGLESMDPIDSAVLFVLGSLIIWAYREIVVLLVALEMCCDN